MQFKRLSITQGEHRVSCDPNVTISTLLGSCVACCLWDPVAAAGGMNHILLASQDSRAKQKDIFGQCAMESLINDLLAIGAQRDRLVAKLFGGAQMIRGLSKIGPLNSDFARSFLAQANIPCVAQSLGGKSARQIIFSPTTGNVKLRVRYPMKESADRHFAVTECDKAGTSRSL